MYPHPIQRAFYENKNGGLSMFNYKNTKTRTQDFKNYYFDCGMFYFGKRAGFFSNELMYGHKSKIIKISKDRAIDIDHMEDWVLAESIFKANQNDYII